MRFRIQSSEQPLVALRRVGYIPWTERGEESSFIRRLRSTPYPRFHAYVRPVEGGLDINLHLDQKKPSYAGAHAHSGEYDGPVIEAESQRFQLLLK